MLLLWLLSSSCSLGACDRRLTNLSHALYCGTWASIISTDSTQTRRWVGLGETHINLGLGETHINLSRSACVTQGFGFKNEGTEALSFRHVYGCFLRLTTSQHIQGCLLMWWSKKFVGKSGRVLGCFVKVCAFWGVISLLFIYCKVVYGCICWPLLWVNFIFAYYSAKGKAMCLGRVFLKHQN